MRELAALFLRIGFTSFGGPPAHTAFMHREIVTQRGWLTNQEFLDLVGATNLIPGPNSTELAIHIGHRRAGWPGLLVAGACFILPATVIVLACAWAYVRYGSLPEAAGLLYGVKPIIVAIVAHAFWGLAHTALKTRFAAAICILGAAANLAGANELVVLLGAALAAVLLRLRATPMLAIPLGPLFWFFAKVGSVLFGSGYVLIAFLRADLVERWGWLTEAQLLDAIAVGQFTPGPVFTTATFIGYVLAGVPGAIVATLGIFLPAFFFVGVTAPYVMRLRQSPTMSAILDAVNAASLALLAVVSFTLTRAALVDFLTIALAITTLAILLRWRINSAWLVAAGALIGILKYNM